MPSPALVGNFATVRRQAAHRLISRFSLSTVTRPGLCCGTGPATVGLVVPTAAFIHISPDFTASRTAGVAWAATTLAWRILRSLTSAAWAICAEV